MTPGSEPFDRYAASYDAALTKGISASGENRDYFAGGRVAWLQRCLRRLDFEPNRILDFGCGDGSGSLRLLELSDRCSLLGVEVSVESTERARRDRGSARARFELVEAAPPLGDIDLAFCNGVFHHVPPEKRLGCLDYVWRSLRPGGLFAFWENNPWNPGARYVMSRIPFDRDAIMLSCVEARRLLRTAGFEIVRTDSTFYFPRVLNWLRWMEPVLARLPLGAQYQVLARKPPGGTG